MVFEEVKFITFVWPGMGGNATGVCHMAWRNGCSVHRYLQTQPLRQHGLLGMWKRCNTVNQHRTKVKLNHCPQPGDTIVISRVRAR